jgi:anhydro-N-acetylmuramic acid kinase
LAARFRFIFADKQIAENRNLAPEDLLATFTEFTAVSVSHSIRDHIPILNEITTLIASCGGVRNKALMERIRVNLPSGLRLTVSDEFGIPAQYKEAIPAASGASRFAILGKLVAAPRLARGVGSTVQQRERSTART